MELRFGTMAHGNNDLITDVDGVRVGHSRSTGETVTQV